MNYIKFVEGDYDTYPKWAGNWDDTSEVVLVHYKTTGYPSYNYYTTGYTDWDGDNHYWNLDKVWGSKYEVISWSYFDKE